MADEGATDSLLPADGQYAQEKDKKNVFIFKNVSLTVKYKYKGGPKKDETEEVHQLQAATTYFGC